MNSIEAARFTTGMAPLGRRALLGALPCLLVVGVPTASGQHAGHTMPPDPTLRARAAEQRTWLGVRLGFIVGFVALYVVWWRYQVVRARRAKLNRKEGRSDKASESPHRLPRQRRRR